MPGKGTKDNPYQYEDIEEMIKGFYGDSKEQAERFIEREVESTTLDDERYKQEGLYKIIERYDDYRQGS